MLKKKIPTPKEMLDIVLDWSQDRFPLTAQRYGHMNIQGLIDTGILRPGSFATSYDCDECCGWGEVIWHESPQDGTRRAYYRCECGLNPVEPEELLTWDIAVPILVQRIGESLGGTAPFREVVPEIVWSLGRKMRREFYYIRCINRRDVTVIRTFFAQYPTAVLVTPSDSLQRQLKEILPEHLCFSLETIGTMDEACRLSVDLTLIESELEPVSETPKRQRRRVIKIDQLVSEMKKHYQEAKDYYYASGGDILSRPTQEELAKRIGASQTIVSRCLKDKKAIILQTLWNNAENLEAILNS